MAIGLLWALATDQWDSVILVAIFFELVWLDAFYIGAYTPPSATTALLLVLPVHHVVNQGVEQYLVFSIVAAMLCAFFFVCTEQKIRRINNHWYTWLVTSVNAPVSQNETRQQAISFKRYLLYQVCFSLGSSLLVFYGLLLALGLYAQLVKNLISLFPAVQAYLMAFSPNSYMAMIVLGGFLGGCLSLRIHKARFIFFASCSVFLGLTLVTLAGYLIIQA